MDGRLGSLRRSASAPDSLESLSETALGFETTPCSVLELRALEDEVSRALRGTLEETQRELLAAVEAGALRGAGERAAGCDSAEVRVT